MKHVKFEVAESILGIQRMNSEVFTEDSQTLCVMDEMYFYYLTTLISKEVKPYHKSRSRVYSVERTPIYNKIKLHGAYHWEYNLEDDEIILVKGYDRMYIVDALGEPVTLNCDIDIC